jgi:hypothetical protein
MGIHLMPPLFKLIIEPEEHTITSTFYPVLNVADTNYLLIQQANQDWSYFHDATVAMYKGTLGNRPTAMVQSGGTSGKWTGFYRGIFCYNVSGLGTKKSAAVRLNVFSSLEQFGANGKANIYSADPANKAAIALADWRLVGSTPLCDTPLVLPCANGWQEFPLNSAGLALVQNGVVAFSIRIVWDATNSPPAWQYNKQANISCYGLVDANKPELVVKHII